MEPPYPPVPNAPPPAGIVLQNYPNEAPPPMGYPQPGGYPAPGYMPPQGQYPPSGYPPAQGYAPEQQQPGQYAPGGYPPPQGYAPEQPPMYPSPGGYAPAPQPGYPAPNGYMPPSGPMTEQPTATAGYPLPGDQGNWMVRPAGQVCPPGLEYLTMIDQLLIHQKVELLEAFISFETKNKYTVKNTLGQKVYTAKEDTDCCTRNCLGPIRPFDMKIKDNSGMEVIHLYRPCRCDSCLCPCCLQKMEVFSPPGTLIGSVTQQWSILKPKFTIENAAGDVVLRVEGPFCTFSICGDVEFKVLCKDGAIEVGKIKKQWSGLLREMFTDSDHFGITFPMDLDVNIKAVLLGACFLIDFMFFEKSGNESNDMPGML